MKWIFKLVIVLIISTPGQAQKEKLELNLIKGDVYTQNMRSDVSILQTINGQKIDMKMAVNGKTTFKVIDIQGAVYEMEVRYESLVLKMSLPNGEAEFSSEKNDENDIFSTILGTLKDKPFLVKMTKTGKVNEVKNIDAVFASMFDKFPQLSDLQKQQVKQQLMQAYGEKAFKGNIEMCSAVFPESPVSKGDKWTIDTQLEAGMSARMKTVYELKEATNTHFEIVGNSKIKTADKDAYIESNGMPMRYDMEGTMISDIKIDKKTGWTVMAKLSQKIEGMTYVKDNPQLPGGMTIPMSMNNEMIISQD